jgi:hypothetical protein
MENYSEASKLDNYNLMDEYLENMNTNKKYTIRRHEANLLILGNLSDDMIILKGKDLIEEDMINEISTFLFDIVSNPPDDKDSGILVGRALWCISRIFSLVKENYNICVKIFEAVSLAICNAKSDLSVSLIGCLCLTKICFHLSKKSFDSESITNTYSKLVEILKSTSEDTLLIPVESILALSKINKEKSLYIPKHALKVIIEIYSQHYSDAAIGSKILELIKFWLFDQEVAHMLMNLFIPFAIHVFDDFFKTLKNPADNFENVKKTVITEVGDVNFKTNVEMLPVKFQLNKRTSWT